MASNRGAVNVRSPTDPGLLLTLFLDPSAVQSFSTVRADVRAVLAEDLDVSPLHVTFWPVHEDDACVEVTVPSVAAMGLKRLQSDISNTLRKLGVLALTEGCSNRQSASTQPADLVSLRFAEKSLASFQKREAFILSKLALGMDSGVPQFAEGFLDLELNGGVVAVVRLERVHSERVCHRLGMAENTTLLSIGLLHVVVRQYRSVGAGSLVPKKEEDSRSSRDPDKPLPQPDKLDLAKETWASWVQLKRCRGCYRGPSIYLVRGKDRGKPAWHYVHVNDSLLSEFLEKTRGGSLDVADYGEVLASGWGEDPPQALADSIDRDYA